VAAIVFFHLYFFLFFFRRTTHSTKVFNLHGYKLPNCIMRVFHLHFHLFFVYFKLVQWALKKLNSTLKWTPSEEEQMDQHTSSYVVPGIKLKEAV
jgi:hypothetical protein